MKGLTVLLAKGNLGKVSSLLIVPEAGEADRKVGVAEESFRTAPSKAGSVCTN